jgi:heat shock protein HslJ
MQNPHGSCAIRAYRTGSLARPAHYREARGDRFTHHARLREDEMREPWNAIRCAPVLAVAIALAGACGRAESSGSGEMAGEQPGGAEQPAAPAVGSGAEALTGPQPWQAREIDGSPVADTPLPTLRFTEDGKVTGKGPCNQLSGSYDATASTLEFTPIVATKMACPGPIMDVEQRFLAALDRTRGYAIEDSLLVLRDASGTAIVRLAAVSK